MMLGDQRERLERSEGTSHGGHVGAETGEGIFQAREELKGSPSGVTRPFSPNVTAG